MSDTKLCVRGGETLSILYLSNDYRWVQCSNKRVKPAMILLVENMVEKIVTEYNVESETTLTEVKLKV